MPTAAPSSSWVRPCAWRSVELRRHGANLVGRCPFHDDQGPSLVVTSRKNLWHCLGACQAGGSAIDWVMRAERVSFRHAEKVLRRRAGVTPNDSAREPATFPPLVVPPVWKRDERSGAETDRVSRMPNA
jgi:DNA primase